jgi:hypothetical protein
LPVGAPPSEPGDFSFGPEREDGVRYLYICLPGDKHIGAIRVHRQDRGIEREWKWDGNEEKPTLSPSILCPGEWHGYLRAGRLESC